MTATFVAIASRAAGTVPSAGQAVRLVAIMLPIQFAIGAANDAADAGDDELTKPYKPIVRGAVSRRAAGTAAVVLGAGGVVAAATVNPATLGLAAGGLAAGLAYDVGLRRTPLSWVPWWGGIALVPLAAYTAANAFPRSLLLVVPLALLVALSLHCANALPDLEADVAAGRRSFPVLLGARRARVVVALSLAAAATLAAAVAVFGGWPGRWVVLAAGVLLIGMLVAVTAESRSRPFAPLAAATAVFAVVWLAALPS